MSDITTATCSRAYSDLINDLPRMADRASLTLCGMAACVDARVNMHDMAALFAAPDANAARLADLLKRRAQQGIGGEVRIEWPDGPAWLSENLPVAYAMGGTGPQAAWTLAAVGAPALMALEDRSSHMLALVPPDALLVEDGAVMPAAQVQPRGQRRPDIFIFEYTAGAPIDGIVPPRSSRIIVRFHDLGLEHDPGFDEMTPALAQKAGAALISGFNCVTVEQLDTEIERVLSLARAWRTGGLDVVHLELAGYDTRQARSAVLEAAPGTVTSLGMSHSEFMDIVPDAENLADGMVRLGEQLGLSRVCVHADHWAASATLGDSERELRALMTGCLLAASRASAGHPVYPVGLDPDAHFHEPPFAPERRGPWSINICASPYLERPVSTLGLGDTFTAGCLLALGSRVSSPAPTGFALLEAR